MPPWKLHLAALADAYSGHGGQIVLAEKLEVHAGTLRDWLNGRYIPNYANRQRIAEVAKEVAGV